MSLFCNQLEMLQHRKYMFPQFLEPYDRAQLTNMQIVGSSTLLSCNTALLLDHKLVTIKCFVSKLCSLNSCRKSENPQSALMLQPEVLHDSSRQCTTASCITAGYPGLALEKTLATAGASSFHELHA